ncbi:obg-like ATPase 1 [Eurytemora carolleeae]|uniref:obg-like ATPase 1 n=1 Tax=Eurytemora carolleeae TaxID=1294199 RepID=UPI000C7584EC|nr:obg-like ATPase 1 [Eurytemora carolleeae]|eukprot:XP_023343658.1 obg-like ATPase 1 [Eurytemora affinis]
MPPKKKEEEEKHVLIGRMGTNLKCGIVGLPNVGKSTFFNVLTKTSMAAAENFPFCTIDPNESRVPVPDERFDWLVQHHKPASKVPAFLNVTDIAGLVKGASEGQGLGNAFLSHIKACDAMFHLCRTFEDPEITHVEGEVDPVRDLDIINEELRLKDEDQFLKVYDDIEKKYNRGEKALKAEYESLQKVKKILVDEKRHIRFGTWSAADIEVLNKYLFITSKPMLYLVNLSEKDYIRKKNKWLPKIKEYVDKNDPGAMIIPFSGAFELKLQEMGNDDERKAYQEETKCFTNLDKIIVQVYEIDRTVINNWMITMTIKTIMIMMTNDDNDDNKDDDIRGTKAPQAAGRIHTDFEKGFIMAEVMKFADFKEGGSEAAVKASGGYRQQGKNYTVEDGDIIFFKFNAGAGLTAAKKK